MYRPVNAGFCALLIALTINRSVQGGPVRQPSTPVDAMIRDTAIRPAGREPHEEKTARWTSYVAPAAMVAYGFTALKNKALRSVDTYVQKEVYANHPHAAFHADDYLIWGPAAAVYGLNAAGIKGEHGLADRSILYVVSFVVARVTTSILKTSTRQWRPDSSDFYAFPSGHATTAFVGAEFLRQEYKGVSPWYGIGGYATAATAGFLRIYNNKHWLSNTIAGAGLAMASVRLVYWVYPLVRKAVVKDKKGSVLILPTYENRVVGIRLIVLN